MCKLTVKRHPRGMQQTLMEADAVMEGEESALKDALSIFPRTELVQWGPRLCLYITPTSQDRTCSGPRQWCSRRERARNPQ